VKIVDKQILLQLKNRIDNCAKPAYNKIIIKSELCTGVMDRDY